MIINKGNVAEIIQDNWNEVGAQSGSWSDEILEEKDIPDIKYFYRNSFARGLMEEPKKFTPFRPFPFNGKVYPGWIIKKYLPALVSYKSREQAMRGDFDLQMASGVKFPSFNTEHWRMFYDFDDHAYSAELKKYGTFIPYLARARTKTICEIGGGFGGMCEMAITNFDTQRYIDIDLFETLAVAMTYLANQSLDRELVFVKNGEDLKDLPEKCVVFISYKTFQEIKKDLTSLQIDLFLNSNSFVEMGSKIIQEYFDFMENFKEAYLFSANSTARKEGDEILSSHTFPYTERWSHVLAAEDRHYGHFNRLSRIT